MPDLIEQYRDRYALSPIETAHALGISRKHVYALMARGDLRSTLIGTCRRIPITEVERLAGITGGDPLDAA
jgi:excisionase family DNA binding protein